MTYSRIKRKRVRPLLGTFVEITLEGAVSQERLNDWITLGFETIAKVDQLMSVHRTDSDISILNNAKADEWVTVHPWTAAVLRASNEFHLASKGTFDIRSTAPHSNPRRSCGDGLARVRRSQASKTGPWKFDLGGIAKGFAVDRAVTAIQRQSRGRVSMGIVNAGGDLRRWGSQPVAVATSAVRTPGLSERLSPAIHRHMPSGRILRTQKSVAVASSRCLWSDALTKIVMMAPKTISDHCLGLYQAQGFSL